MKTIEAGPILSSIYGNGKGLIACDTVRILNDRRAIAEFTVGRNHCSPMAKSAISRHNMVDTLIDSLSPDQYPLMAGFDSVYFNYLALSGQQTNFFRDIVQKTNRRVSANFTRLGEKEPFAKNFWVETDDIWYFQKSKPVLAHGWIFEFNAQALSVCGLYPAFEGVATPAVVQSGPSYVSRLPICPGDRLTSYLEILTVDKQKISANVQTFFLDICLVAEQQNLLLQFVKPQDRNGIYPHLS